MRVACRRFRVLGRWIVQSLVVGALSGCGDSNSDDRGDPRDAGGRSSGGGGSGGERAGTGGQAEGGAGMAGSAGAAGGSAGAGNSGEGGGAGQPALLSPHAIASTSSGTCALDADGTIHCWGLAPNEWTIPAGTFTELHSSDDAVCAVKADKTVQCFAQPRGMVDLSFVPSGPAEALSIGPGAACTLSKSGIAACDWSNQAFAIPPPEGEAFSAISIGYQFACGIRDADGSVVCWGSPGTEQCAWGPAAGQLEAPEGSFVELSSRLFSSCALSTDGSLACWGAGEPDDDPEALCRDETFNFGQSSAPSGQFRAVKAGANNGCGIRADGTIACWGAGTTDECEQEGVNCRQSRPPAGTFEQIALGAFHGCAMKSDRTVVCWGWDGAGDGRTAPPTEFQ